VRERLTIIGAGAFFALGVVGAFGVDAVTSYREHMATAEREVRSTAALVTEQTRQLFAGAEQTLKAATLVRNDWVADPARTPASGHRMLRVFATNSDFLGHIMWTDAAGKVVVSSASETAPALDMADRSHFQFHVDRMGGGMFVSAPFRGRITGEWIGAISRRIETANDEFVGIVTAVVNASYLTRMLERYHVAGNVTVALFLRDGQYLARFPGGLDFLGKSRGDMRLFREKLPYAPHGTFHAASERSGEQRVYSYRTVDGPQLIVAVSMTHAVALEPWYGRIRVTGMVTALALLGAFLATSFIWRQSVRVRRQERIAQEARLLAEHSSRSKSEFLAHMSHELRTPMNAVIGFTEMIRKEVFGPVGSPKYQEYLRDIAVSGQHLLHVVNNILDLAKVEAGKWEMEETVSDVRELCDSTAQMVRERARSAEVGLTVAPVAPDVSIRADRRLIRQILINLLTNGIKFTERGGRLTLWWALTEVGDLALNVTDTGVGMTEDDRRSVLEPFGRGSAELARARHDTGLGLSICRTFAEMHGGRMEIDSALGKGTTVTVFVPAARVVENHAAAVAAA
jgi:signal transduction histidine kinase